mmetsp:Transcript_21856/g.70587  ORF Transcript_21856/g.70587 Transcript_21856/m.70587 type:complete len:202 (+) Transcript_21856:3486-4091(+)
MVPMSSEPTSVKQASTSFRYAGVGKNLYTSVLTSCVSKMYPKGIQLRNLSSVWKVQMSSDCLFELAIMYSHSWKMREKSALKDSFSFFAFIEVISSREKSNTSSESNLRMAMLFSQRVSSALEALTISEMNDGQLCGHSCLTIWTRMTLSFVMKTRSRRKTSSLDDLWMTRLTMKFLIPTCCSGGKVFHRYLMADSRICSA